VADSNNHRVQKFTANGTYLTQWGRLGSREGQFYWPSSIMLDGNGNAYVVDAGNDRLQVFAPQHPLPDPVHGLALNGSFEETPDLVRWTYGGALTVTLASTTTHGSQAAQLGVSVPQTEQPKGMAWLRQTIYVRPEWERPVLTFRYRMFVNDIVHYSDFHVWLTRTDGAWLAEITRDGFRSCQGNVAPPVGYDLGWRAASFDLSPFKGRNVRLVFENRNLHDTSWGIWTVVDEVRVVDAGPLPDVPLPGPYRYYFPLAMSSPSCDPVVTGLQVEAALRPSRP